MRNLTHCNFQWKAKKKSIPVKIKLIKSVIKLLWSVVEFSKFISKCAHSLNLQRTAQSQASLNYWIVPGNSNFFEAFIPLSTVNNTLRGLLE